MGPNPILISNQALQQIQTPTISQIETTGEILYANSYAGVNPVPMPVDLLAALNSDYGETGNNIIIQLQQKIQQFPDGPWYVDSINGTIYIHNRKLLEPPVAVYTYQSENGELLNVSFETQYTTKILRGSTATGIDMNKGMNTEVMGVNPMRETYLEFFDPITGSYKPQSAINAYSRGNLSYGQILTLNSRVKESRGIKTAFTKSQWDQIKAIHKRDIENQRKAQQSYTDKKYEEFHANEQKVGYHANKKKYISEAVEETLKNQDLSDNVIEFLGRTYGPSAADVQRELDEAAKNGTLDELLKRRFQSTWYTFSVSRPRDDNGAVVKAWGVSKVKSQVPSKSNPGYVDVKASNELVDKNPYMKRVGNMKDDWTVEAFTKRPVEAKVTGYRLLRAYYTRKSGTYSSSGQSAVDLDLSRRIIAAANESRKITEKKLVAKAIVVGRPSLKSSQVITLHNVGKKWSGNWYIKSCIHRMVGSSGYTTELELIRHNGVEGYSVASQSAHKNNSTAPQSKGGKETTKSVTSLNLTVLESNYFQTATPERKEDLIVLKMAGQKDAVIPTGNVGSYNKNVTLHYKLVRRPTKEERKKYGRAAAKAVDNGIKSGIRK